MKIQMDDVIVNYQPKFFTNNTTEEYHEIISPALSPVHFFFKFF